MSTYTDASLIYYPSGVKAGKAYSLKPTDGSGDLTFTRASTATRVNESGLIEEVATGVPRIDYTGGGCGKLLLEPQRTNLVKYSQTFTNVYWNKVAAGSASIPIVTANFAISPDGTQNADRLQCQRVGTTSADYSAIFGFGIDLPSVGNITIYVKSLTLVSQNFLLYWGGNQGQTFNVGTEWTRINLLNCEASNTGIVFGTRGGSGDFYNGGDLDLDIAIWGIQMEAGSYPTSYIPTTTTAVTRVADSASVTTPVGVTQITETFGDGSTNVITTIPATYTASLGQIQSVIMI